MCIRDSNWENDAALPAQAVAEGCKDIALQLIEATRDGRGPSVMLGGGRKEFLTTADNDAQLADKRGLRRDGRNLIHAWQQAHPQGAYVETAAQLAAHHNLSLIHI